MVTASRSVSEAVLRRFEPPGPPMWGSARLRALVVAVVAALVLVPVWASPVLVTNDGPSHVYNALVVDAVRSGRPPYSTYMEFVADRTRPNQAAQFLLVALGRTFGWELAERLVVTFAVAAVLVALLALVARPGTTPLVVLAPAAGWLAQSWFLWMGFYDFALSLACYAALVLVFEGPPTPRRRLLTQALLLGLYMTHVLTFAVGTGLALAVTGWRALTGRGRWVELAVAGPALALLLLGVSTGGTGAGALRTADAWLSLKGLVIGDFVMSVHVVDAVAGALLMVAVWFAVARQLRAAQHEGLASVAGAAVFGFLLLMLSVAGPDRVGEGGFVAIRLRCLGAITLLPSVARALATVRLRTLVVAAGVVLVTLGMHAALIVRDARIVGGQLALLEALFTRAQAPEGAWLRTRFRVHRGLYTIGAYTHIAERLAVRRGFLVLDNYEALYNAFAVSWRAQPDWLAFRQSQEGLTIRLIPGRLSWSENVVYVLHESERRLQVADPRLDIGPTLVGGPFALTPVRRRL
ncbi:MAG TPA: hypothetical protein VEK86_08230 [Gemmatimonadales bacterium]|nr:hypothetical protein [Gemmatimonadales bacterium]